MKKRSKDPHLVKISHRVFRYSVIMAVQGIIVTMLLSYWLHMRSFNQLVEHRQVNEAREAMHVVDEGVDVALTDARWIAQSGRVHEAFRLRGARGASSRINLESLLTARVWHVTILDLAGQLVSTTRINSSSLPGRERWWKAAIERSTWIGTPYRDPAEAVSLLPIAVVSTNPMTGAPEGVVRIELNWQNIVDALRALPNAARSSYALLSDSTGNVLADASPEPSSDSVIDRGGSALMVEVTNHGSGVAYTPFRNSKVAPFSDVLVGFVHSAGSFEYPGKLDWWIGVVSPVHAIRQRVYATIITGLALTSLVAGLLIFGVFIGTSRILLPLDTITRMIGKFGQGQLDLRLDIQTGDELEGLAGTFNEMADGLKSSRSDLEFKMKELFEVNEHLKEHARLKAQLVANISHELRTPLHSIIGFTELTIAKLRGSVPQLQLENLERVRRNSNHLLEIINNILDFSKLDAGKMTVHIEDVDLREELSNGLKLVEPLAAPAVRLIEESGAPIRMRSDRNLIQHMLMNLLSNAVKFTSAGSVTVSATESDGSVIMIVADTGIGIEEQNLELIFDEFRQVDGSSQRQHGGTGLGLTIVRRMAARLGGTVRVESKAGAGSTFKVVLPLVPPVDSPEAGVRSPEPAGGAFGPN